MGGGQSLLSGANAARADLHSSSDERLRAEIAVHLHLAQGSTPDVTNRELLERAYKEADSNADGKLDFDEFAAIAHRIGLGVSELQLRAAFGRFDVDSDGRISFAEVVDFISPVLGSPEERSKARAARNGGISTRHAPPLSAREYAAREVQVQQFERIAAAGPATKTLKVSEDRSTVPTAVSLISQEVYKQQINLRHAFKKWDADGSGGLDVNEFTSVPRSLPAAACHNRLPAPALLRDVICLCGSVPVPPPPFPLSCPFGRRLSSATLARATPTAASRCWRTGVGQALNSRQPLHRLHRYMPLLAGAQLARLLDRPRGRQGALRSIRHRWQRPHPGVRCAA